MTSLVLVFGDNIPEDEDGKDRLPPAQCEFCGRFINPSTMRSSYSNPNGMRDYRWDCSKCGECRCSS